MELTLRYAGLAPPVAEDLRREPAKALLRHSTPAVGDDAGADSRVARHAPDGRTAHRAAARHRRETRRVQRFGPVAGTRRTCGSGRSEQDGRELELEEIRRQAAEWQDANRIIFDVHADLTPERAVPLMELVDRAVYFVPADAA